MVSKHVLCRERVRQVPDQFCWLDQRLVRHEHIRRCDCRGLALYLMPVTVAEHVRCYDRGQDFENPDHVRALLEQRHRARLLPEAGALHLTRRQDLLELDLPQADITLYGEPGTLENTHDNN